MQNRDLEIIPYDECTLPTVVHFIVGILGYVLGFLIFWLFYRSTPMAIVVAFFVVPGAISVNISSAKKRRLNRLLSQFQSMLESLVVSLQSGSTDLAAFKHALADMELMYSEKADIVKEVATVIAKFDYGISIGEALMDIAERSKLEDIKLFANVYLSIQGKGDKTREIVMKTQKVLSDKITIQNEIKTISSGALMEINIMVVIPIVIVAMMGFMGGELMGGLFTTGGRIATTFAICIFIGAYFMGKKIASIEV